MRTVYLDYCTTTPVAASVRDSMLPFLNEFYGHPSSDHWYGRAAQEAIEDARSNVSCLIGCHPSEVIFTSGGTESVNLGLLGLGRAVGKSLDKPHLITSHLDHSCVRLCAQYLQTQGWEISCVGCDENGVLDLDELEQLIKSNTRIVSVIHGSHRIGTIQPIELVAEICQRRDILLHVDACQTVGKIECHVDKLGVDLLTLSGHKIYAPKGVGALFVRTGVPVDPIMFGEGCEAGLRPGTANVPHIVGLGQAAKMVLSGLENNLSDTTRMRDFFRQELESALGKTVKVHGESVSRLPSLLSLELPGVRADDMQRILPNLCFGPCASNGIHNGNTINPTHSAMGLSYLQSASTLRVSFGWTTSEEEVEQAVQMIAAAYDSLSG